MNDPCISIDRAVEKIAVFDGFKCVRNFTPYTDEAVALAEARAWVAERTSKQPDVIYPRITRSSMRVSRRKN